MKRSKSTKNKKVLSIVFIVLGVLIISVSTVLIYANVRFHNALKEEEMRLEALEKERIETFNADVLAFTADEYNAAIISMQGSKNWSAPGTVEGYLGLTCIKNGGELTAEDTATLVSLAACSDSIERIYMIVDPVKFFEFPEAASDEEEAPKPVEVRSVEMLFEEYPEVDFTVYTPFYSKEIWQNIKFSDYENVMYAYRRFFDEVLNMENVTLMSFTGDRWLLENEALFEEGDLRKEVYEKMFLYSFMEGRVVDEESSEDILEKIENNCLTKTEPEPKARGPLASLFYKEPVIDEQLPLEEWDVVFVCDSLFALSDGVYSSATVFEEKTGARTYNISKGGMAASRDFTVLEAVNRIIDVKPVEEEGYESFDKWLLKFAEDDHTNRKMCFIFDTCTNDYIGSYEPLGDGEDTVEGASKAAAKLIKEQYPDSRIIFLKPYIFPLLDYGKTANELGYVFEDYRETLEKVCLDEGYDCFDMQQFVRLNGDNARYYLDDAVHPSVEGCYVIADGFYPLVEEALRGIKED